MWRLRWHKVRTKFGWNRKNGSKVERTDTCTIWWSHRPALYPLNWVSIGRGRSARQCSLLSLAKSISCCRARQNEHCRKRTWRVSSQTERFFVPGQRDFSVLCSFSWDGLVAFRCFFRGKMERRSTASRGCRASMVDTNKLIKADNPLTRLVARVR
jgi:hypothetical protein